MRFVADENVDLGIVAALRAAGHDVWYVAEQASGLDDSEVLAAAASRGALLLTSDKDFGELVFRQGRASSGVMLLRLAGQSAARKAELVTSVVGEHEPELAGAFSVLTATTLRVRRADSA